MKRTKKMTGLIVAAMIALSGLSANANNPVATANNTPLIQVALLLDTSSSMDGLIDQAKARLWDIVNTLTTLKYTGKTPIIEIALYEYGNNALSEKSNYIRCLTPLTADLDVISEMLFSLTTWGGAEYCGAVIHDAVKGLKWGTKKADMKLIYIAGNEGFNQGSISYKKAISEALEKDIYINTIYCGDKQNGIREQWKTGADLGKGKYFNIDYNRKVRHIVTPYDDRISSCNQRLNNTYIAYGTQGYEKQQNQIMQDRNASSVSKENYVSRAVSKSKAVYKNTSWDLVDLYTENEEAVASLSEKELPEELQDKSKKEIEEIVLAKQQERQQIQQEINELSKKRQEYIDNENKKNPDNDDLGNAINSSVVAFAKMKGYEKE